jgi:site-specific recombinase XerD
MQRDPIPSDKLVNFTNFPLISEVPAVQALAVKVADECHTLGYDSIVHILPFLIKSVRADTSRRVYLQDILHFTRWLHDSELAVQQLTTEDMLDYYIHLERYRKKDDTPYSRATINRMFTVARQILERHVHKNLLSSNPAQHVDMKQGLDETTHAALTKEQSEKLLAAIDISTVRGKMQYALVSLMLRTGIRRDECRNLNIGDIQMMQGHHIAVIRSAKGGDRQIVKVPPDVWCDIDEYMQTLEQAHPRRDARLEAPLFISFRRGDHPSLRADSTGKLVEQRIDVKAIETLVKDLGHAIGVHNPELTPHGLRATFVTLLFEEGATITEVQYATRHKDPRTVERYQKRKFNLDRNAVDRLSFLAKERNRQ